MRRLFFRKNILVETLRERIVRRVILFLNRISCPATPGRSYWTGWATISDTLEWKDAWRPWSVESAFRRIPS